MVVSLGLSAGIIYEVSRRRWSVRRAFRTCYAAGLVLVSSASSAASGLPAPARLGLPAGFDATSRSSRWQLPPVIAYQFADSILLARERYEGYAILELSHPARCS